ncbi:hypothetical protein Klosneuvirus_4_70 [Klosneuvirus KNV1]|uniref:Uncharacterized protein n=1 Tax=Klosneuvirus KNV1 TaxID=1977640 RepID=A0A1V0SKI3_9VIRU|nr:hypothetical protein Klosneuvirus_4_70 [Klosneuvirus KNV1]
MCDCNKTHKRVLPNSSSQDKQIPRVTQLPPNFNWKIYKELNPELANDQFHNMENVMHHWYSNDNNKNIIYSIKQIIPDFDWKIYKELNPDLKFRQHIDYELHWVQFGQKENRQYKYIL